MRSVFGDRKRLKDAGLLAACLAGFVAVGGFAYAAIPSQDGVIHACYNKSNGALRVIDSAIAGCSSKEYPITWNQVGPMGPQGAVGADGPTGPQGAPGAEGPTG